MDSLPKTFTMITQPRPDVPPTDSNKSPFLTLTQDCLFCIFEQLDFKAIGRFQLVSKDVRLGVLGYHVFVNRYKFENRCRLQNWWSSALAKSELNATRDVHMFHCAAVAASLLTVPFVSGWVAFGLFAAANSVMSTDAVTNAIMSFKQPSYLCAEAEKQGIWVKDQDAPCCCNCGSQFGLFLHRHHCRTCFNVFCYYCLSWAKTWGEVDSWQCKFCVDAWNNRNQANIDNVDDPWLSLEQKKIHEVVRTRDLKLDIHQRRLTNAWVDVSASNKDTGSLGIRGK